MNMIKNKENKKQVLVENFSAYNGEEPATLKGYVERESENDPGFFRWLFDDGSLNDFGFNLTDEQRQGYKEFLDSLSDASSSDPEPLESLAAFNEDETSLYFKEKDLERNGYDMLDITEAYPEYDFVERESDGRLVFHLSEEK